MRRRPGAYFRCIAVSWTTPAILISLNFTDSPTLTPCSNEGDVALKAMVIAGQLSAAIGPCWMVTIPFFASTAFTTPAPSAMVMVVWDADMPGMFAMFPAGSARAGEATVTAMAAARNNFISNSERAAACAGKWLATVRGHLDTTHREGAIPQTSRPCRRGAAPKVKFIAARVRQWGVTCLASGGRS